MPDEPASRGYRVVLSQDPDDGSWAAEVPDLPGCVAAGTSPSAAIDELGGAIDVWLTTAVAIGRPVPMPSHPPDSHSGRFVLRLPRGLHGRLVRAAVIQGVSLNTYCATVLAEAVGAEIARRERRADGRRLASGRG
jgi:predicted RNase H-like HicB family nuclease